MPAPLRAVLADQVLVSRTDDRRRYEQLTCAHPGKLLANADARAYQQERYAAHLAAGGRRLATISMPPAWFTDAPWPRNPTRATRYDHLAAATRRRCQLCDQDPTVQVRSWLADLVSEAGTVLDLPLNAPRQLPAPSRPA